MGFLSQFAPLVNIPILGESLLGYWLESLVAAGEREALVLATDRPDQVRELAGNGARWGLAVEVRSELRELTPSEALARHCGGVAAWRMAGDTIRCHTMDHFPGMDDVLPFESYSAWFAGLQQWWPRAITEARVGVRQIRPGIWMGLRSQIAPSAQLIPPCWLGSQLRIGPDSVIGPEAVLEDRVVVESASEIARSVVGPETFIGSLTRIQDSIAWGNTLINWRSGSCTHVPDAFLMCPLGQQDAVEGSGRLVLNALLRPWALLSGRPGRVRGR
jgi:NDP-sugar pyrophosphorylase family protein